MSNIKRLRLSEFLGFLCGVLFLLSKIMPSDISLILILIYMIILPIGVVFIRIKGALPVLIIRIILPIIYLFFSGSRIISYCLDIPNVICSNYDYVEGQPQNIQVGYEHNSQTFIINGINFEIEKNIARIDTHKIYGVKYLTNSKYVIDISEVKHLWQYNP